MALLLELQGSVDAVLYVSISRIMQVYITEICTPEWRTTFNSGLSAFYMIGMVIVYTLGKPDLLTWRWLAGVSCVFPVLSVLLLGFIPESPAWLVTQGRLDEARKGLVWLRGTNYDISEEFNKLEASYAKTQISKDKEERGRKFFFEKPAANFLETRPPRRVQATVTGDDPKCLTTIHGHSNDHLLCC